MKTKISKIYYNFSYCKIPQLAEYPLYAKNKACAVELFNVNKNSVHSDELEVEFVSLKEIGREEWSQNMFNSLITKY